MRLTLLFQLLQILGEKSRDLLELWHVPGIYVHQGLMGFQTGSGELGFVSFGAGGFQWRQGVHGKFLPFDDREEVAHPQVFQQFDDASVWIEKLDRRSEEHTSTPVTSGSRMPSSA